MIKYIGYFDTPDSDIKRYYSPASIPKMKYIAKSLANCCGQCEIISLSPVIESSFRFYSSEQKQIYSNVTLRLFHSFGGDYKVIRGLRYVWHLLCLFLYLLKNTKKDEKIVCYHSLAYYKVIIWAKKIKQFKLILELNEIYSDVINDFSSKRKLENSIIRNADAYIIPTILLNEKYNKDCKPYIINHSTYEIVPQNTEKFDDGKIHVVYAGTFDPNKGGCLAAEAAVYLPSNFHLHILGFGSKQEVENIMRLVKEVQETSEAVVTYDGLLLGNEFVSFLQKCHIGLSTQDPNSTFNDTSFPSKLLTYLSNGLTVITIDIKAIKTSKISHCLNYYKKHDPETIANAIKKAQIMDNRLCLLKLDEEFQYEIKEFLSNI